MAKSNRLSSPWLLVGWGGGVVSLLIGLGGLLVSSQSSGSIVATAFLVGGAWLFFRTPFCGVSFGDFGVKYRGIFSTKKISWPSIDSIKEFEASENMFMVTILPVVELKSGDVLELKILAGYAHRNGRNSRVSRQYETLREAYRRFQE